MPIVDPYDTGGGEVGGGIVDPFEQKAAQPEQQQEVVESEQPPSQPDPMAPLMQKLASGETFTPRQNEALAELIKRGKISGESFSTMGIPGSQAIGESQGLDPAALPAYETLKNIGKVYPALETAVNAITSSYGIPASGLAGILSLPLGVDKAAENVKAVQEKLVYEPQTKGGEQLTDATTYPFQKLEEGASAVSDPIAEAGFPGTAAVISAGIQTLPAIVGARKTIKSGAVALDNKTKMLIKKGITKSIRPTVTGKATAAQRRAYFDKAQVAVESIVENKKNLDLVDSQGQKTKGLPKTLDEFSQAVEQTKKGLFEEYDALAKEGGAAKEYRKAEYPIEKMPGEKLVMKDGEPFYEKNAVSINIKKTIKELDAIKNDKIMVDFSPETIKYAEKRIEALKGREDYTAVEAQNAVQFLNQTQKKFYADPSPAVMGEALVDSLIANDIRSQLGASIEKATGKEYSALKRKYGSLKAIEKEVNQRAMVDERKNVKGLVDFSDIASGAHVAHALMKADPASMVAGATAKGIAARIKALNDPNKIVKAMFKELEKSGAKTKPNKLPGVGAIVGTEMQASKKENK